MTLRSLLLLISLTTLTGCFADFTDAATRLAYDIEASAGPPGQRGRRQVQHPAPHSPGD